MKGVPVEDPFEVVTTTFPLVAPLGTGVVMLVELQFVGVAAVPLNVTLLEPWLDPKLTPEIVTEVPAGPAAGARLLIVGVCDTVKGTPLLATPPTVTTMFPDVAFKGTGTVIVVPLQAVGAAVVPLNVTVLAPWAEPKFEPVIVTGVSGTAVEGETAVIDGATV